jgi:hypothetical protein
LRVWAGDFCGELATTFSTFERQSFMLIPRTSHWFLGVGLFIMVVVPVACGGQESAAGTRVVSQQSSCAVAPTVAALRAQVQQIHDELQVQIDELRHQLGVRDVELRQLKQGTATQAMAAQTPAEMVRTSIEPASVMPATPASAGEPRAHFRSSSSTVSTNSVSVGSVAASTKADLSQAQKSAGPPAGIRYRGLTLVPSGFMAGESVWRQRAMSADIYTNWNSAPFANAGQAHVSEWVPTARQSRFGLLATGATPAGRISGYLEGDFLSAGVTSNNVQSNSYTLRLRQAWVQDKAGRTTFTGGQMWTLLTENKRGTAPGQEAFPLFFDANLHVGYTYARQTAFRVERELGSAVNVAAAVENSQYQFSASNAPANFFFGNAGAAGGLNNSTANYTDQFAPDVIAKISFDPHAGHYEIGGIVRAFRDRHYPSGSASAVNDTRAAGGILVNAKFPLVRSLVVGGHLLAGQGVGRYGASLLPEVTVHPNGTLEPLRNAQAMFSIEAHPNARFDLFGYAGTEYAQRTYYASSSGSLVGYAPPSLSNSGCQTEAPPAGTSGALPGSTGCAGMTRDIVQGTFGWLYRPYSGPAGRLQYGLAYSYFVRNGWAGVGGAPRAANNAIYTSIRYYLP